MKLRKLSQLALASGIGIAVAASLTACQLVTVDYVYLAGTFNSSSSSYGAIQAFAVDSQSGAIRYVGNSGTSPVNAGGNNPVAMAVSADYNNLYVANADNNTVVHFSVAASGALTQADTVTLSAPPTALTVGASDAALFVVSGTTTATLTEFALSSGKIGSVEAQEDLTIPGYANDNVVPTAVAAMANGAGVYAAVYDQSAYNPGGSVTSNANPGWVFGFAIGSNGALTPANSSPYRSGVKPSGIAIDPANRFVYVTDFASNDLIGYGIISGTQLSYLISGPYKTGNQPSAVTIDPRGKFIYVANSLDSTVSAFAINLANGIPSAAVNVTGSTSNQTDTQPNAIVVEPAEGRYVYTANYLGNSVSGFKLDPNTGTIAQTQATPYPSEDKPTAIVAVPHGNHSLQVVAQ